MLGLKFSSMLLVIPSHIHEPARLPSRVPGVEWDRRAAPSPWCFSPLPRSSIFGPRQHIQDSARSDRRRAGHDPTDR